MTLDPGGRLGPYELQDSLGRGGMGVVHRARDTRDGRAVALKVIHSDVLTSGESAADERFLREARAAQRIEHPNVVRVLDAGEERGTSYIVFELVEGLALDERLLKTGKIPWREAASIAAAVARGLAAAHAKGVIHRDVKPGNVICSPNGAVKLADFGLARGTETGGSLDGALTRLGEVVGTPEFLSPEQANAAGQVGPASDLYSLGATLFTLLTATHLFEGPAISQYQQHLRATPAAPSALAPDVPRALDALVLRLLAKDPAARGGSAADVARELDAIAGPPRGEKPGALARVAVRVGVGLVLIALLAFALVDRAAEPAAPPPPPQPSAPARALPQPAQPVGPAQCRSFAATKRTRLMGFVGSYAWRHSQPIEALAWAPDGRTLFSTGGWTEKTVRAWRAPEGSELWTERLDDVASALDVSADGKLVAVGCHDGSAQLRDAASGALVAELPPLGGDVRGIAFVPRRACVVYGGRDGRIKCVDTKTLGTLWNQDAGSPVEGVVADPKGALVATALHSGDLILWKSESGDHGPSVKAEDGFELACLAWAPDGSSIATGNRNGAITPRLPLNLDRQGEALPPHKEGAGAPVVALTFVKDENRLVSSLLGGDVLYWQLTGPKLIDHALRGFGVTKALAATADGRKLATGGDDRRIRVFDLLPDRTRPYEEPFQGNTFVSSIAVIDSDRVVVGGDDGALHLLDTGSGRERVVPLGRGAIHAVVATGDHRRVFCGTSTGAIVEHVVGSSDGREVGKLQGAVKALALSSDDLRLAAGSDKGQLSSWLLGQNGELEKPQPFPLPRKPIDSIAWSADGKRLVAVMSSGLIFVSGHQPAQFRNTGSHLVSVACGPDKDRALVSAHEEKLVLWDLATNEPVEVALPSGSELTRCVWLDARHVAVGSYDGTIRILDVARAVTVDTISLAGSHDFATALAARGSDLYAVTARGVALRFAVALGGE